MAKTIVEVDLVVKGDDSVAQASQKTKSLKQELKEMKELLASGTLGKDQFTAISKSAGELQDRIQDVSQSVKNLSSDTKALDGIVSLTEGIVGGFTAFQGIAALVGDENEELNKTLVKLQGSIAALSGIQAVANSFNKDGALAVSALGRAWTGLNNALKASIIGAIAAIVLGVVYAINNLNKELSESAIKSQQLAEINKNVTDSIADETSKVQQLIAVAQNENISKSKRLEALRELNIESPKYLGNLNLENINTKEATEATNAYIESLKKLAVAKAFQDKSSELLKKRIDAETLALEENLQGVDIFVASIKDKFQGTGEAIDFATRKATENREETLKSIDKEISALNDLQSKYIEEGKLQINTAAGDKKIADDRAKSAEKAKKEREERLAAAKQEAIEGLAAYTKYQDDLAKANLSAQDYELLQLQQSYENQRTELENHLIDTSLLTELYEQNRIAVKQKYANEERAADEQNYLDALQLLDDFQKEQQDQRDNELSNRRFFEDQKASIANAGINLLSALSGKNKELAIASFILEKAAAVGSVIINTQREIAGYYANPTWSALPDGGITLKTAAATGARIRSGLSLGVIAATSFGQQSGSGNSGGSGSSGFSSSNSAPPPPTAFTINPDQFQGQDRMQKTYVLEKDIRKVTSRVAAIRKQSVLE